MKEADEAQAVDGPTVASGDADAAAEEGQARAASAKASENGSKQGEKPPSAGENNEPSGSDPIVEAPA